MRRFRETSMNSSCCSVSGSLPSITIILSSRSTIERIKVATLFKKWVKRRFHWCSLLTQNSTRRNIDSFRPTERTCMTLCEPFPRNNHELDSDNTIGEKVTAGMLYYHTHTSMTSIVKQLHRCLFHFPELYSSRMISFW